MSFQGQNKMGIVKPTRWKIRSFCIIFFSLIFILSLGCASKEEKKTADLIYSVLGYPHQCSPNQCRCIFAVFYKKYWAERWLHPNFEDQRELPKYQSENPISGSMIWETYTFVEFIQILHLCCMKNPLGTSPIFVVLFQAHLFSAKKNSYFFSRSR